MIDVFEFIKEKKADFKDNTERYRVMLEPKFKALSEKLNGRITNTLNNPWMFNLPSIDRSKIFKKKTNINNEIDDIYLVRKDIPLADMKKQDEEVDDLQYLSLKEFKKAVFENHPEFVPHPEECEILFKNLQ